MTSTNEQLPVPMGVIAETGETHPFPTTLPPIADERPRGPRPRALAGHGARRNDMLLSDAGWGILFSSDANPAIKEALTPLLALRQEQVNNEKLFKIFEERTGVGPNQTAAAWTASRGVSLAAPVNPNQGVPFYLLIVGDPGRIPFGFQSQLDAQWAVGRLAFDRIEDYDAYARAVVAYERGDVAPLARRLDVWIPRNPLDIATALLAGSIQAEFQGHANPGDDPIGTSLDFTTTFHVGQGQATKARLADVLSHAREGGPPALLFTGSHGAEWSKETPDLQRARQGALVTQEWARGQPLDPDRYFAAEDLPASASLHGMIAFLFACFGGGCPARDSYYQETDGTPKQIAPDPLVSALPQAMLRAGALAVIAHVDRAFSYAFEDVMGTPQAQLLRQPLELLMAGKRVGLVSDAFSQQWGTLAGQIGMLTSPSDPAAPRPTQAVLANLLIARDDARNYIILGDPAVGLRGRGGDA